VQDNSSVSVVIPVHNGQAFIAEALNSVRAQTLPMKEIIVVNDGSTDQTDHVVASFPEVILLRQARAGAAAARNTGARRASGDFLAFLDADDLWPGPRIERQLAVLAENPKLDFVSGNTVQFRRDKTNALVLLSEPEASRLPSVLLMRRESFWRAGAFSTDWEVGETIEWWSRAIDVGLQGQPIPETVLLRRRHSENLGRTVKAPERKYLEMLHAVIKRRRAMDKREV